MYLINIFGSHIYNYMQLYVKLDILEIIFFLGECQNFKIKDKGFIVGNNSQEYVFKAFVYKIKIDHFLYLK